LLPPSREKGLGLRGSTPLCRVLTADFGGQHRGPVASVTVACQMAGRPAEVAGRSAKFLPELRLRRHRMECHMCQMCPRYRL